jgi:sugar phosphate isomerase/epimerase
MSSVTFSVFTKPWKMEIAELGRHVSNLGFEAIEFPVRPGYPVTPDNATAELPKAVKQLADFGVKITSIAGPTDEKTMAACAEAGVPIIRICVRVGEGGYLATEARLKREYEALVPLLDRYGVTLGIQNHCGRDISNAMGLRSLIGQFDPKRIAAVWDAAHNALNGEEPELAIDIIWSHMGMVNLKNAYWQRANGPEADHAKWRPYWTTGRHGLASWPRVAKELKNRNYNGVICLCAEYSDEDAVDRLTAEDLAFAKSLFE